MVPLHEYVALRFLRFAVASRGGTIAPWRDYFLGGDIMEEIWRDVVGYEGFYKVSNFGNIASLNYKRSYKPKLMKPSRHHTGYNIVKLSDGARRKTKLVHVLVAQAFIPQIPGKRFVNHIDGNKSNNFVGNLEWVTVKENTTHAIRTGLRDPHNVPRKYGKDHYSSKPVLQYDSKGNFIKKWDCQSDASRAFGGKPGTVSIYVDKPNKLLYGYMWVSYDGEIKEKIPPSTSYFAERTVCQFDLNGNLISAWNSSKEAAKALNLNAKYIREACYGRIKTHGGFAWRWASEL